MDYYVGSIDVNTVSVIGVNGVLLDPAIFATGPSEIGDYDSDGIPDLMVKFDRAEVQSVVEVGEEELIVAGKLDDGTPFEGSDTIRVIERGK